MLTQQELELLRFKKDGVKISTRNKKIYKGEPVADILVISPQNLKSINYPQN